MERKILFEKSVICPGCAKQSDLLYPNPRLYIVASRESDQHVTGYSWLHGIETDIQPHYYAVWQCPFCFFSDLRENIEDFKKTIKNGALIKSFHSIRETKAYNVLKAFRRLSIKGYTAEGVIGKHLSAIYIASLPKEQSDRNNQNLGRLYLRLGWLFRELHPKKEPVKEDELDNNNEDINKIYDSVEQLEHYYLNIAEELNSTKEAAANRAKKMDVEIGSKNDPYYFIIENISDKLKVLRTAIELARHRVTDDREGRLQFVSQDDQEISTVIFKKISQLLPLWPEMPVNEKKAMEMAVESLDYSFRQEDSDRSNEQGMSIMNLILRILIRVGNLDKALEYVNKIYKMGFREKQALQARLNNGKQNKSISSYDEKMMLKKIGSISMTISRAGESRKQIFELIYQNKSSEIEKIITTNSKKSYDQLIQLLIDSGISEDMIPFLEEKNMIKDTSKKGWFGKK